MEAVDVKRLTALELENSQRKKLLAERDLDVEIKEINEKNREQRFRANMVWAYDFVFDTLPAVSRSSA